MNQNHDLTDHRHVPPDIAFEYGENKVVPISAMHQSGHPYSGRANGSIGAADWSGYFVNGRPHGEFFIQWGGTKGGKCIFDNGIPIDEN